MSIAEGIIAEIEVERASTRRVLERIADDKWDWKPHEKSMAFGQLGSHIAETMGWAGPILDQDTYVFDMEEYTPYIAESNAALLKNYDETVDTLIGQLAGQSDEHLLGKWQMATPDGTVMIEMPRVAVLKMFMVAHTIHHRGQLSVYLRLNDIPVPAIYGPSADEEQGGYE